MTPRHDFASTEILWAAGQSDAVFIDASSSRTSDYKSFLLISPPSPLWAHPAAGHFPAYLRESRCTSQPLLDRKSSTWVHPSTPRTAIASGTIASLMLMQVFRYVS